jgi:tRNA threonylcarbamoyladenosine modification (KEOPS) complex  Pcc1 subunit
MENEAIFRFRCKDVNTVLAAIRPEMEGEVNQRSAAECWCDEPGSMILRITATDIPALRASLNMWLRLTNVAREMQELVQISGEE